MLKLLGLVLIIYIWLSVGTRMVMNLLYQGEIITKETHQKNFSIVDLTLWFVSKIKYEMTGPNYAVRKINKIDALVEKEVNASREHSIVRRRTDGTWSKNSRV